jgi:hypothetical protein
LIYPSWRFTEIPHEAKPGEGFKGVVRDIDLPPVKPLSLRARVSVMVVVPSLSKCNQRKYEAVLAVVAGFETSLTDDMSERVDAECSVIEQSGADTEPPREHLKGARS